MLAHADAVVSAFDISQESVRHCRAAVERAGVGHRVSVDVMSMHDLRYAADSYDVVHGQDILHHVDVAVAGLQLRRVLRPGGRAIFKENSSRNKLLMLVRDPLCGRLGIPKWNSDDEYPLRPREIRQLARALGGHCRVEHPDFRFFHYLDAKLLGYRVRPINQLCFLVDQAIYRWLPFLRKFSDQQLVILHKTGE